MPQRVDQLLALLDLEQIDVDLFRGHHPETHMQRAFGGQVLSQSLSAAYRTVGADRVAHSLNAYFLRPGTTTSPILYAVDLTRDGRSFSSRRVVARQEGRPIFTMACSFHVAEHGLDHQDHVPEGVRPPEACPPLAQVLGARSARAAAAWDQEWSVLDVRYAGEPTAEGGMSIGAAQMQVWVRTNSRLPDDPRIHQMALAYASDLTLLAVSTVPHHVEFLAPTMQAASIDHAMWFHRPIRADEWLLYDQVSPSASKGLGFSFGRLFSGQILGASCAQEGLIRVLERDPDEPADAT